MYKLFFSSRTSSRGFFVHIYLFTVDFCLRLDKVDTCSIKVFVSALFQDHHLSSDKINNTGILLNDAPSYEFLDDNAFGRRFRFRFSFELADLTTKIILENTESEETFELKIVALS